MMLMPEFSLTLDEPATPIWMVRHPHTDFEDKLGMCISVLEFRHYKNSVAEIQA